MSQLSIYDIALSYPDSFRTEIKAKSGTERGKLALIEGQQTAGGQNVILMQWETQTGKKKQMDLNAKVEADYKFLRKRRDVDGVDVVDSKELAISGHQAHYRMSMIQRNTSLLLFKRIQPTYLISVHVFCDVTNRFITFFWSSPSERPEMKAHVEEIAKSLKCHKDE